jgi:hypothetical protein
MPIRTAVFALVLGATSLAAQGPRREAPTPSNGASPIGTFVAARIDREALPVKDQVVDDDGTLYFIEFDRLVMTLREDGTFRASVRYRRTLFANSARGRVRPTPLQNITVTGRYEHGGGVIRFDPDETEQTRGLRMMNATVAGASELSIPFNYRNGQTERRRTLVMMRRTDVF